MLVLIQRAARPDARYWPGRRWFAAVDAVAWPLLWMAVVISRPFDTGLLGQFVTALAIVAVAPRLHRAYWRNERYQFTTWRWGKPVVLLAFVGAAMRMAYWL